MNFRTPGASCCQVFPWRHESGWNAQMSAVKKIVSAPAELGFRMPAEWDRHEATWLVWPHRLSDWPGKFASIPWVYGEIVRRLAMVERVRVLVASAAHEARARRILTHVGAAYDQVDFLPFPTDRGWIAFILLFGLAASRRPGRLLTSVPQPRREAGTTLLRRRSVNDFFDLLRSGDWH